MDKPICYSSPEAHTHMNMLQGVISRMASNSANCKALCTTLVSTVGAVAYAANTPEGLWIATIPIILLAFLDARYLSLEKGFVKTYNNFVEKLHAKKVIKTDLFIITPPKDYKQFNALCKAFASWSVCPIYFGLLILSGLIMFFIRFSETI
ncbi:hypothetical protein [Desulfovibrio sp. UCD-KL4C]|uniref:hypothetical protein n=1 Tax=Desulfovibrio sp. UCD-KL4C TaxID=2578120 RepID=UPI0025C7236C|nr:hypothetical protein [Desulfovibrio sp. UCD-KL4C]